jgi:hypothetical protein
MKIKQALRESAFALLSPEWQDRLLTVKHSISWKIFERNWHLASDHDADNVSWLRDAVGVAESYGGKRPISIMEFGCNAGNNLGALRTNDRQSQSLIRYCGIDINPQAIQYAQKRFPHDRFFVGNHAGFLAMADDLGSFDLFLASHVLYYIEEKRVRQILDKARQVAEFIVVCDRLDQFYSEAGKRTGLFLHPYRTICDDLGLEIITAIQYLSSDANCEYGYFVARSPYQRLQKVPAVG